MQITPAQQLYFEVMQDLHEKWHPHPGQVEVLKPLIEGKVNTLFLQCGRKFGKTETAVYMLWRQALLNPGSACYYVGPSMVHARKLIWTDPRLSTFGNPKYVHHVNNTEMIVKFHNGSYIQVIGSENYASANGLRPSMLVYDEFCAFEKKFHDVMQPNRVVYKCPLIIIGTPPIQGSSINREQYLDFADECRTQPDAIWMCKSSYANPHIPVEELNKERDKYLRRGEEYLWETYYMARTINGGPNMIFPMLNKESHVVPQSTIMDQVRSRSKHLDWYLTVTPGATSTFGALFVAIDQSTKKVYILDELYERSRDLTSVQSLVPKLVQKADQLIPHLSFDEDWVKSASDDQPWFGADVMARYGYGFMQTPKAAHKKETGISLIKDALNGHLLVISERCEWMFTELQDYATKPDGSVIKGKDCLIEALRNTLAIAHYSTLEFGDPEERFGPRRMDFSEIWEDKDDKWS